MFIFDVEKAMVGRGPVLWHGRLSLPLQCRPFKDSLKYLRCLKNNLNVKQCNPSLKFSLETIFYNNAYFSTCNGFIILKKNILEMAISICNMTIVNKR